MVLNSTAATRDVTGPTITDAPFSWNQTVVLHEGETSERYIGGYDPGLQPLQFQLKPYEPTNVRILQVDAEHGFLGVTALANHGGTTDTFPFQVQARGVLSEDTYNLVYDVRTKKSRIRGTPILRRSPGDFVKPGHIVRYVWTQTGQGEKHPKVEAAFTAYNGPARGPISSTITAVLGTKAQPFVLGYYVMTVTPRDVRGEPPRGSTSNGVVFRCAFGSDNLAPVVDGLAADTFLPAAGQTVTMSPIAFDPETGQSTFDNEAWDFGDGTLQSGLSGAVAHAYAQPGIYRARCTVADNLGAAATTEDSIVVGATNVAKMAFTYVKSILPEESGSGLADSDTLTATFRGVNAQPGDRIVFTFNRNQFGRMNASSAGDDTDIVLKPGGFTGSTRLAKEVTVTRSAANLSISVSKANFDRTGDPRFGRCEQRGIFKHQRIALCVIPANGGTPRTYVYTGNVDVHVKWGPLEIGTSYFPEDRVSGASTTKEPNPKKQEIY
ncbi:MAG TPA: PKD domain-containing protein [Planctomycetota bacterium]|jgi:hypothetical protein